MASQSFIPPGQEQVAGAMLGNGVTLPGDCKLASGNLDKTTITATYSCPTGEVVVELSNPATAPSSAPRTEKFALRVERGTPPPDLQRALLSRIRERESQFQWTVYPDKTTEDTPPTAAVPMLSGAVALGVFLIAALLLWRRRTRATPN